MSEQNMAAFTSFVKMVPREVLLIIFAYLDYRTLCQCAQVRLLCFHCCFVTFRVFFIQKFDLTLTYLCMPFACLQVCYDWWTLSYDNELWSDLLDKHFHTNTVRNIRDSSEDVNNNNNDKQQVIQTDPRLVFRRLHLKANKTK